MINEFTNEGILTIEDHFGNGEPLWRWKEYGKGCAYSWDDLFAEYNVVVEDEEEDCGRTLDSLKVWLELRLDTCVLYTSSGNMLVRELGEKKPKSYKEYSRHSLGWSDVAAVTLTGCDEKGHLRAEILNFNFDGQYTAYIVDEYAEIGDHYHLVYTFYFWMRVYDDEEMVVNFLHANEIKVYRAGDGGCIIQLINMFRVDEITLSQRLIDAGYPAKYIFHYTDSDQSGLRFYANQLTWRVLDKWLHDNELSYFLHSEFTDHVTGARMYDVPFAK